jgi:hypothetical protein
MGHESQVLSASLVVPRAHCEKMRTHEAPDGRVQQLGVGREADVLGLHRGIDRDPLKVFPRAPCRSSSAAFLLDSGRRRLSDHTESRCARRCHHPASTCQTQGYAARCPSPRPASSASEQPRTQKLTGCEIERGYVDKGYRGHDTENPRRIFISGQKRGVFGAIKRELRRRSAIEPVIGHMKAEGHLGRCYLKGRAGDAANAILSAVGYNFRRILAWLRALLRQILIAILRLFIGRSSLNPVC